MSSEPRMTGRQRLSKFLYGLSGVGIFFGVFIALTGGFRFEVLIEVLDQDGTLVAVSDHGIQDSLLHHIQCMLVLVRPGLPPGSSVSILPIDHLPSVILAQFGSKEGSEVLTADGRRFFIAESQN